MYMSLEAWLKKRGKTDEMHCYGLVVTGLPTFLQPGSYSAVLASAFRAFLALYNWMESSNGFWVKALLGRTESKIPFESFRIG